MDCFLLSLQQESWQRKDKRGEIQGKEVWSVLKSPHWTRWSGYWHDTGCVVQGRDMAADLDVLNLFVIAGATLAVPILAFVASVLLWPSALVKVYYW